MAKLGRNEFLQLMAAAGALSGCTRQSAVQPESADQSLPSARDRADFSSRVLDDVATGLRGALCYMGDSLGIFDAMAGAGPMTVDALAAKTE